jgi:hypothetical protein
VGEALESSARAEEVEAEDTGCLCVAVFTLEADGPERRFLPEVSEPAPAFLLSALVRVCVSAVVVVSGPARASIEAPVMLEANRLVKAEGLAAAEAAGAVAVAMGAERRDDLGAVAAVEVGSDDAAAMDSDRCLRCAVLDSVEAEEAGGRVKEDADLLGTGDATESYASANDESE